MVVLILLTGNSFAVGVDNNIADLKRATRIMERLAAQITDPRESNYKLSIDPDEQINAYAYFHNNVAVTKGMMRYVDDDELAVVIGHEIGHHRYGDVLVPKIITTNAYNRNRELMADQYGVYLAQRAGFNGCKGGMSLYGRWAKEDGYRRDDSKNTHPASVKRYEAVKKMCGVK